jgi:DNA-directed RNA polymerase specialized sigma24 family protein
MAIDAWFSDLYERNYVLLYRVGSVFLGYDPVQETLIEDQIQEAFVRAWQKRSVLKKHPNPDGWLTECFRRCLMNACRKKSREFLRVGCRHETDDPQILAGYKTPYYQFVYYTSDESAEQVQYVIEINAYTGVINNCSGPGEENG